MEENELQKYQNNEKNTISVLDILHVLTARWKLIIISTVLSAILILGYSYYTTIAPPESRYNKMPNIYKPTVKVMLQGEQINSASVFSGNIGSGLSALAGLGSNSRGGNSSVALAQELLLSNTILDQIAENFGFYEGYTDLRYAKAVARRQIKSKLETKFSSTSGILEISYTDTDPELATQIVNQAVILLENRFKSLTMSRIHNKKQFLEERIAQVESQLKEAQTNLINFQVEKGIVDFKEVKIGENRSTSEVVFTKYLPPVERNAITLEYFDIQREKNILEGIYELLMNQYEATKIEEMDDSKTFQILEVAEVPIYKFGPNRKLTSLVVIASTLILSIIISFIFEYFARLKQNPTEEKKLQQIKNDFFEK